MYRNGSGPAEIVERQGLGQISDAGELGRIVDALIEANPGPVQQYRDGKKGTIGWFVGQVMKATAGRANPKSVNEMLTKRLAGPQH
jgi:aspartyl-tRNA(Asn)/glutamyl-tRNA(Gln) amidotransferase subunit B